MIAPAYRISAPMRSPSGRRVHRAGRQRSDQRGTALITVAALAVVAVLVHRHGLTDVLTRSARGVLRRYNRARRRAPDSGLDAVHSFVGDLLSIRPHPRDWLAGLAFASLNWVADLICLAACCRAVGAGGTTAALVLAAYVAGMSTSSLSLLPGGFGVVDAAMVLALTSGGGRRGRGHRRSVAVPADQPGRCGRVGLADLDGHLVPRSPPADARAGHRLNRRNCATHAGRQGRQRYRRSSPPHLLITNATAHVTLDVSALK
jgi:hypothetical protein